MNISKLSAVFPSDYILSFLLITLEMIQSIYFLEEIFSLLFHYFLGLFFLKYIAEIINA